MSATEVSYLVYYSYLDESKECQYNTMVLRTCKVTADRGIVRIEREIEAAAKHKGVRVLSFSKID